MENNYEAYPTFDEETQPGSGTTSRRHSASDVERGCGLSEDELLNSLSALAPFTKIDKYEKHDLTSSTSVPTNTPMNGMNMDEKASVVKNRSASFNVENRDWRWGSRFGFGTSAMRGSSVGSTSGSLQSPSVTGSSPSTKLGQSFGHEERVQIGQTGLPGLQPSQANFGQPAVPVYRSADRVETYNAFAQPFYGYGYAYGYVPVRSVPPQSGIPFAAPVALPVRPTAETNIDLAGTFRDLSTIGQPPVLRSNEIDAMQVLESQSADLGRGVPLAVIPENTPLYIVEFKAGRTDLYYCAPRNQLKLSVGDYCIVEGDRGKDMGRVLRDKISTAEVAAFQRQQAEHRALDEQHGANDTSKDIMPKRIYSVATDVEKQMLLDKMADEAKALALCKQKVKEKGLNMVVVDAEFQWDRRKLIFYFESDRRIDFRDLVRELFKYYKTRIWMSHYN